MGLEVFRMQSLNIDAARKLGQTESLETPAPPIGGDTGTPYSLNTPDILNSLISITSNPFFNDIPLTSSTAGSTSSTTTTTSSNGYTKGSENGSNSQQSTQQAFGGDEDRKIFATLEAPPVSGPSPTIPNGHAHPSSSSFSSAMIMQPTSVQSMTSQLIKDSLKHTIQSKRKNSGKEDLDIKAELQSKVRRKEEVRQTLVDDANSASSRTTSIKLTPEDEERRKRRRERNKVAATKCRNKKKEKTGLLAVESESLEGSNVSLKTEISQLEQERQQLMEILAAHKSVCTKVHLGGRGVGPTTGSTTTSINHHNSIVASSSRTNLNQHHHLQQQQHQHQASDNYYLLGLPHNNNIHTNNSQHPHLQYNHSTSSSTHPHLHLGHSHIIHHNQTHHHQQSTTIQL